MIKVLFRYINERQALYKALIFFKKKRKRKYCGVILPESGSPLVSTWPNAQTPPMELSIKNASLESPFDIILAGQLKSRLSK